MEQHFLNPADISDDALVEEKEAAPQESASIMVDCADDLDIKLDDSSAETNALERCAADICLEENSHADGIAPHRDSSASPSPPSSSKSSSLDLSDIKPANIEDSSYNSIMSVCSTAAQHIRQTITEVLNSRLEENAVSVVTEDAPGLLEASVKQKLEDFENTVKNNMLVVQNFDEESTESNPKCLAVSEKVTCEPPVSMQPRETCSPSPTTDAKIEETQKKPVENTEMNGGSEQKPECGITTNDDKVQFVADFAATDERSQKKTQRKESTNKKKGEKTIDQILKSLSNLASVEDKLQALCRKHTDTLEDLKYAEQRMKQSERQVIQLSKEKEQLQGEHNRMVLAKSRLESLCRELQRQNKAVKEESLLRIREEEEKRKEVASKFQTTLNEISNLMQENSKKNIQLKEENAELAQKLKTLVEHYEMWEKHMEKVVQQKDLEAQLAKAKHAKTNLQLKQETEKFLREKQSLLENMSELQKKCTQLASNELQLRAELGDYTSKYEEFQSVLSKSNQVFASFKMDMESTSKKIRKLEKETNIWKQKWENSNNALLEMVTDKQKRDKELVNAQNRILTLEKLCRALQAERNDLQNQVKAQCTVDEYSTSTETVQSC